MRADGLPSRLIASRAAQLTVLADAERQCRKLDSANSGFQVA